MKYLIFIILFSFLFLAPSKVSVFNQHALGVIEDSFEVNSMGAYNHIIPIHIPPGVNNLVPTLALVYDSRAGISQFGKGWNLTGLSKITRSGQSYFQNGSAEGITLTDKDNFLLDGQYLTLISGKKGESSSKYRTENESFFNIVAEGQLEDNSEASPKYFFVKQPNGLTYYYGNHNGDNSQSVVKLDIENRREGIEWNVSKIEDQYGNYIEFEYALNNNVSRITRIKYTGNINTGLGPTNEIVFEYENHQVNRNIEIINNNFRFDDKIIKSIQVDADGEFHKYYHFNWDKEFEKIISFNECSDQNVKNCVNPTKVRYNEIEKDAELFQKKEIKFDKLDKRSSNLYFEVDLNNNGKAEYILLRGEKLQNNTESKMKFSLEIYKGGDYPSSINDSLYAIKEFVTFTSNLLQTNSAIEFVDFNGDGLPDILSENTIWVNKSTHEKINFDSIQFDQTEPKNVISTYTQRIVVDLEGDGRSELLAFNPDRLDHLMVRLNPDNNTVDVKKNTNRKFTSQQKVSFDGVREEILLLGVGQGANQNKPFIPGTKNQRVIIGTSWEEGLNIIDWEQTLPIRNFLTKTDAINELPTITDKMISFSDVNFDGLPDMIIQPKNINNKAIVFWLNNGSPTFKDEDKYFGYSDFNYKQDEYVDIGAFISSGSSEILQIKKDTVTNFYIHTIHFNNQLAVSNFSKKLKIPSLTELKWEKFNNSKFNIQFQDFNGDQFFDVRISNELNDATPNSNVFGRTEYLSQNLHPDLLETVVDGFGNVVKVEYGVTKGNPSVYTVDQKFYSSLESYSNYNVLHYPLTVVKRVEYSNGLENDSLNATSYVYSNLVIETKGRRLCGFQSVSKTDEASKLVTSTTYEFEFPLTGKIKEQTKNILGKQPFYKQSNSWNFLCFKKGRPCRSKLKLNEIDAFASSRVSYLPILDSTEVINWELDGGLVSQSQMKYSYSQDGQILKSENQLHDGSKIVTEKEYYPDYTLRPWRKQGIYLKGLVKSEKTYTGNGNSRLVTYEYYTNKNRREKGGLKTKIRQPDDLRYAFRTSYIYDDFGNTIETNENGLITKYNYESTGKFVISKSVQVNETNIHTNHYELEPLYGNIVEETDPNGNWIKRNYDLFGKLESIEYKDGRSEKYLFEYLSDIKDGVFSSNSTALYKLTTHTSGSNPVYRYFDKKGREVGSLYNLIDSTYVGEEFLPENKMKKNTVDRYVVKLSTYDALGNLRKDYHPRYVQFIKTEKLSRVQGNYVAFNNSDVSECFKFESSNNWYTEFKYDEFGRLIEVINADGVKLLTEFSTNKKVEYNGKGQKKTTIYNSKSEVISVFDHENSQINYTYDSWGNLTAINTPDGSKIQSEYDVLGRKIRLIDPNIGEVKYEYDVFDRIIRETTGSREIQLEYDILGRIVKKIADKKDTLIWEYDTKKKGLLSFEEDMQKNKKEFFYDNQTRLTKVLHTLNETPYFEEFEYDSLSRLVNKSYNGIYKVTYLYSNNIQMGVEQWLSENSSKLLFKIEAVNAYGNVTHKKYGNKVSTNLKYFEESGLLKEINTQKTSITFSPTLQECSFVPNIDFGTVTHDVFPTPITSPIPINNTLNPFNTDDPFNPSNPQLPWTDPSRPEKLAILFNEEISQMATINESQLQKISYKYDKNYNVTLVDDILNSTKTGYVYDNLNRLTRYENSNFIQSPLIIDYHKNGNITFKSDIGHYINDRKKNNQVSYIVDGNGNQINSFIYDQYGNIIEEEKSKLKLSYTAFNKPYFISKGAFKDSIWYGSQNEEVYRKKFENDSILRSETIRPFIDLEIEKNSGIETNIINIRFGSDLVAIHEVSSNPSTPSSLTTKTKYIHKDHLGSIDIVTDEDGVVVGKFQYSPFGERITEIGDKDEVSRGFTGHKHYETFGLIDAGGRYYIPSIGRFASADPFIQSPDNLQSINRYSYVQNNPLNSVDPSGFIKIKIKNPFRAVKHLIKGVANAGRDIVQGAIDIHKNIYDEGDRFVNKHGKQIVIIAAAAAITYFSAGTAAGFAATMGKFGSAMLTGAKWGAGISATIAATRGGNFQDVLNAGYNGAIMGATAAAAAHSIGTGFEGAGIKGNEFGSGGYFGKTAAHGISGGIQSDAAGGSFKNGFLSASISNAFTPANERIFGSPSERPDYAFQRIAFSSAIGGMAAHAGGGDFTQGAITAGFIQGFNHESTANRPAFRQGNRYDKQMSKFEMDNYLERKFMGHYFKGYGALSIALFKNGFDIISIFNMGVNTGFPPGLGPIMDEEHFRSQGLNQSNILY